MILKLFIECLQIRLQTPLTKLLGRAERVCGMASKTGGTTKNKIASGEGGRLIS